MARSTVTLAAAALTLALTLTLAALASTAATRHVDATVVVGSIILHACVPRLCSCCGDELTPMPQNANVGRERVPGVPGHSRDALGGQHAVPNRRHRGVALVRRQLDDHLL